MINKFLDILKKVEFYVILIVFIGMVVGAFAQVIFRLVLDNPLAWSEELCRYCFVWLVFIGGGWAVSGNAHFRIDFLIALFPKTDKGFTLIARVCMLLFGILMLFYGIKMLEIAGKQISPALQLPMSIPYAALPISGALVIIHEIEHIVKMFKKKDLASCEEGGTQ